MTPPLPKPRLRRGTEYRWWMATVRFGGIKLIACGATPAIAYAKLLNDPIASNEHGYSMRSR